MENSFGAVYYNFPHAGVVQGFFDGHPFVSRVAATAAMAEPQRDPIEEMWIFMCFQDGDMRT